MIGCLRTRVRKQPIIALYFKFESVLKFYSLGTIAKRYIDQIGENDNRKLHFMTATEWQFGSQDSRFGSVTHRIMQS